MEQVSTFQFQTNKTKCSPTSTFYERGSYELRSQNYRRDEEMKNNGKQNEEL